MYDEFGRLIEKGGEELNYLSTHPHAVHSAFGWTYNYNQNGDVVSKAKGAETYTFTYSSELKVATISLNGQALHKFGYDSNGQRVARKNWMGRSSTS